MMLLSVNGPVTLLRLEIATRGISQDFEGTYIASEGNDLVLHHYLNSLQITHNYFLFDCYIEGMVFVIILLACSSIVFII